eukprot:scaffold57497_cov37-Prasinocladus_malaysianus.AAC.2
MNKWTDGWPDGQRDGWAERGREGGMNVHKTGWTDGWIIDVYPIQRFWCQEVKRHKTHGRGNTGHYLSALQLLIPA